MLPSSSGGSSTASSLIESLPSQNHSNPPQPPPTYLLPVERFKDLCLRPSISQQQTNEINNLLGQLFSADKPLNVTFENDSRTLELYLTGGIGLNEFKTKLKEYDNSSICGLVWNINYIAYRCRTCALSPCMSICAECFKNGDHQGHDYNMFRSGAGGACDCGDECVMSAKGFCKSHGCHNKQEKVPPVELTKCCEVIISHLLYRIVQYYREHETKSREGNSGDELAKKTTEVLSSYINLLNELCLIGTPLRTLIVDFMINEEFYANKIREETTSDDKTDITSSSSKPYSHSVFTRALHELTPIQVPSTFNNIESEMCKLTESTLMDEYLFWCMKLDFQEDLVKFLLSLLPDMRYKQAFIKSFVSKYSYISVLLLQSHSEQLSSKVVHISVQLFSNEAIALKALDECHLLPIMLSTLHNMIVTPNYEKSDQSAEILLRNRLENVLINEHLVVNPDHSILHENLYWLVISDLVNLFSHRQLATGFMKNRPLVELWVDMISYFQTMNLNVRQFNEHVAHEEPTYFSSFSAELEFCASVMWSLVQHLKSADQLEESRVVLNVIQNRWNKWLDQIGWYKMSMNEGKRPCFKHLSFHLPLNRYYSTFLYNTVFAQQASLDNLLVIDAHNIDEKLLGLVTYPLQLQIGFHEIHANMWVRNGMQMKGQAMTYIQNHFASSFNDADLFLIQATSSRLDSSSFMKMYLERFHLSKWIRDKVATHVMTPQEDVTDQIVENNEDALEPEHLTAMQLGSLSLLAQILTIKPHLRLKSYTLTRNEIVHLLSVSDRTFSQIEESLPDICSLNSAKKFIEPVLNDVGTYLQPTFDFSSIGNMKQGRYQLNKDAWLGEYDPLLVLTRSVKRREFQESFDRYLLFAEKHCNKSVIRSDGSKKSLWPPFRLPMKSSAKESLQKLTSVMIDNEEFNVRKEIEAEDRLDDELLGRWNILNAKSLHSLILMILFENINGQGVNEKILYFTIYVLELAIYMKKNLSDRLASGSSETTASFKLNSSHYDALYSKDDIGVNICLPVAFKKPQSESHSDQSKADQSSGEFNFMSDPFEQKPTKKICLDAETSSNDVNYESILSLLVKSLHRNVTSNDSTRQEFKLEFMRDEQLKEFQWSRLGDENDFVLNLLYEAYNLNQKCREEIERCVEEINSKIKSEEMSVSRQDEESHCSSMDVSAQSSSSSALTAEDELRNKKNKAKARQQKLLAKISSNQKAFLANPVNKTEIEAFKEFTPNMDVSPSSFKEETMDLSSPPPLPNTSQELCSESVQTRARSPVYIAPISPDQTYDCCICRFASKPTSERPIGLIALVQSTNILGHRESKSKESKRELPLVSEQSGFGGVLNTETLCWRQEETRLKNLTHAFNIESCKMSINVGWKGGCYVQMCGHYLHYDCYTSYKQTQDQQSSGIISRSSSSEYQCPLCRQLANCFLPIPSLNELTERITTLPPRVLSPRVPDIHLRKATGRNVGYTSEMYELTLDMLLNSKPVADLETELEHLSQTKNEVVSVLNQIAPVEFRYLNHTTTPNPFGINKPEQTAVPSDDDQAMFALSVLRTQLELDLMQYMKQEEKLNRSDTTSQRQEANEPSFMVNFNRKRACFVPLFDVVSTHSKRMCYSHKPHIKQWLALINPFMVKDFELYKDNLNTQLKTTITITTTASEDESKKPVSTTSTTSSQVSTGSGSLNKPLSDSDRNKSWQELYANQERKVAAITPADNKYQEVPQLLKDSSSILLLIISNFPINFDKDAFTCVVSKIFNLNFIQAVIDLCVKMDPEERKYWSSAENLAPASITNFKSYIGYVIAYFNKDRFFDVLNLTQQDDNKQTEATRLLPHILTEQTIRHHVESKSMHFLRMASLLKCYLFNDDVSKIQLSSFDNLINYLEIKISWSAESGSMLEWPLEKPTDVINFWLDEIPKACINYTPEVKSLLKLSFDEYHYPQLLSLPKLYSDLFNFYHNKKCMYCNKTPKETIVCLICGAQLSYKSHFCCDRMREMNKRHVDYCGSGTLVLLNINSTYVLIVRGKRCASWVSLYLDEHGEEDRDLKRGKPLYLSEQRYNLLKTSWRNHSFDYQSLKWHNATLFI